MSGIVSLGYNKTSIKTYNKHTVIIMSEVKTLSLSQVLARMQWTKSFMHCWLELKLHIPSNLDNLLQDTKEKQKHTST